MAHESCGCLAAEGDAGEEGTCDGWLLGHQHLRVTGHVTPPGSTPWLTPEEQISTANQNIPSRERTQLQAEHLSHVFSKLPGAVLS